MFRIAALIALAALAAGCATTQAAEPRNPYPREKGKVISVPILGSSYAFPGQFDLVHHVDNPGIFGVELVDRTTACEALMNFETTSDAAQLRTFTNQRVDEVKRNSEQRGLKVDVKTEDFRALNHTGRVVLVGISNPADATDTFYFSRYELFIPEESIAYHGYVECAQNPLRVKTMEVARTVIASRGATSEALVVGAK